MRIILLILIFLSIFFFLLGLYYLMISRKERQKLADRLKGEEGTVKSNGEKGFSFSKLILNIFEYLGNRFQYKKEGNLSLIRHKFILAGLSRESTPILFSGAKVFFAILFLFLFVLINSYFLGVIPTGQVVLFSIASALLGFYLPNFWLNIKIKNRTETIFRAFPDALDMMVVCVEAGMGLDSAISRVGEELKLSQPELADELKQMTLELMAGKSRHEALRNLGLRINLEEIRGLVSLLVQTDKFGTSMAQSLRVYSESMRTKRFQKAEEIAAKIGTKLIFPLVLFIFPAIIIVAAGPALIMLFKALASN